MAGWRRKTLVATALGLMSALPIRAQQASAFEEGTLAFYRGEYERVASLADGYLKTHPAAASARILLARAEMALGKHESAFRNLRRVLRAHPENLDALFYMGVLCFALSQIEHQKLFALAPDSARVHQLLAESYRAQHKLVQAEEEYLAGLRVEPNSVELLDALGDLKRSQFRFDEAITYYARAREIAPGDYLSAYGLGASHLFKQQPEKAVEYLRRAVAIDPDSPAARLALGDALWRTGNAAEAIKELKAATVLEPDMRQAYTLLARAHSKLGQSREAQEALTKAQEITRKEKQEREALLSSDDLTLTPLPSRSGDGRQAKSEP